MSRPPSSGSRHLRALPQFRLLWSAATISRWGDTFNTIGVLVLVFRLTHSGLGVAGAVVFEILPVLIFAPVAGALADRLPPRRVMVGADLVRAGLALFLAVGPHHLPIVYGVAFG